MNWEDWCHLSAHVDDLNPPSAYWYQEYFLGSGASPRGTNEDWDLLTTPDEYRAGVLDGVKTNITGFKWEEYKDENDQ